MSAWTINGPHLTEAVAFGGGPNKAALLVRPHQGMGDHILCNGLYRTLADAWHVTVLCWDDRRLLANVRHMLGDRPDIQVQGYRDDTVIETVCRETSNCVVLRLGYASEPFDRWHFDEEFYRQAEVPFAARWDRWVLPPAIQVPVPAVDYTFLHDKPERQIEGVTFSGPVVRPGEAGIFNQLSLILGAKEIHSISSSFAALADCYDLSGKKLVFYRLGIETPKHKNDWTYAD